MVVIPPLIVGCPVETPLVGADGVFVNVPTVGGVALNVGLPPFAEVVDVSGDKGGGTTVDPAEVVEACASDVEAEAEAAVDDDVPAGAVVVVVGSGSGPSNGSALIVTALQPSAGPSLP